MKNQSTRSAVWSQWCMSHLRFMNMYSRGGSVRMMLMLSSVSNLKSESKWIFLQLVSSSSSLWWGIFPSKSMLILAIRSTGFCAKGNSATFESVSRDAQVMGSRFSFRRFYQSIRKKDFKELKRLMPIYRIRAIGVIKLSHHWKIYKKNSATERTWLSLGTTG